MMIDKAGLDDSQIYEKMQVDEPFKRYKKTTLGKVFVFYLNSFDGKIEGKLLVGNPRRGDSGCFISVWSIKEDAFFKNVGNNKKHLETGRLVEVPVSSVVVSEKVKTANELTDHELEELVNSKGFFKLQNKLNQITAVATIYRLLDVAEQNEKSEKILNAIRARLSELEMTGVKEELE
jgi:hypothetical protein